MKDQEFHDLTQPTKITVTNKKTLSTDSLNIHNLRIYDRPDSDIDSNMHLTREPKIFIKNTQYESKYHSISNSSNNKISNNLTVENIICHHPIGNLILYMFFINVNN